MGKKLTTEFVKEELKKEGYELLSKEYINNEQKLNCVCPNNHEHNICWSNWQQGHRCPYCAGQGKPTIEFIKKQFEKENYILLSSKYKNCESKLEYICSSGHRHSISWHQWKTGYRCPYCAGVAKPTIEFVKSDFMNKRCKLLTNEYINNRQKLRYICSNGHEHNVSWHDWVSGHGCPYCANINNTGENNPNWKGGISSKNDKIKSSIEYKEWRLAIFEKDNYTCQCCGDDTGGNLNSHHIESFNNNPTLRTTIENGITLCENCHKNFHHQYGYGNNTRIQLEEFLCTQQIGIL